eukprot:586117-Amphidinium_carterae.1
MALPEIQEQRILLCDQNIIEHSVASCTYSFSSYSKNTGNIMGQDIAPRSLQGHETAGPLTVCIQCGCGLTFVLVLEAAALEQASVQRLMQQQACRRL